jgi:mRNA interferase MazF
MPATTIYSRGDVVLVGFVFSDESGMKLRPAVIISGAGYHRARQEMVVAAITSNVERRLYGDHRIADWKGAGLLFPSIATAVVRTIKQTMAERKLGSLSQKDLDALDRELRRCLGL